MSTRGRVERTRPSAPVTCRLNLSDLNRLTEIATETGETLAQVMEKLLLYALDRALVKPMARKTLTFEGEAKTETGVSE